MIRRISPSLSVTLMLATLVVAAASPISLAKGKGPGNCNRTKTCDTRAPVVSIDDPDNGASIRGSVSVSGSATDNGEIMDVQVSVDTIDTLSADGTTSWTARIDTTGYADGAHLVTVTATDSAGNIGAASVEVVVDNAPPVGDPPPGEPPPSPPPPSDEPPPPPQIRVEAPVLSEGAIGGFVFRETDRDGVFETDEEPLVDQRLYLFDGAGTYVKNASSDATGWYQFTGLARGLYRVELAPQAWWELRESWVPDTTTSLHPELSVDLTTSARADLGWRPIVRSADREKPISSYVGPSGLTVHSYDDVVPARAVFDRLMSGSLVGEEARFVTVRFDLTRTGSTSTMASGSDGVYDTYEATSNVTYLSWLEGDGELFHEYGHAWSLYYAYVVNQDVTLARYLEARGLLEDPRIDTGYAWSARELVAEDYRQLFGTSSAREASQLNTDIPAARDVAGLREFLESAFTRPPGA